MMRTKKLNLFMSIFWLACVACSEDDLPAKGEGSRPGWASMGFETRAQLTGNPAVSRSFAPEISKAGFRILAFKKNADGAYVYTQDVPTAGMNFADNTLSGPAELPIGEYKFVPTYGAVNTPVFSWPELAEGKTPLIDTLSFAHTAVDGTSVVFLETRSFQELPSYAVGLTATTADKVYTVLKRAVARVDLLFMHVKKNTDGSYTEITGNTDVFGGTLPSSIEMRFRGLNRTINVTGENMTADGTFSTFDQNYTVEDLQQAVTIGNGPATLLGTDDFFDYDQVKPTDIRSGAAHVQGAYLLPYPQGVANTDLTVVLTQSTGIQRTLVIPSKLPLERNKVTLVKIYLLIDDGGGDIFDSNVTFTVTVDTRWDGCNVVEG